MIRSFDDGTHRNERTLTSRSGEAGGEAPVIHAHSFFGSMTPIEWAIMGYKHLDDHLRQFGT
jgi:hypothetical protein